MRIVHVSDFYVPRIGGIETQVRELARCQAGTGHDVHVVTATGPGDEGRDGSAVAVRRIGGQTRLRPSPLLQPGALRAVGAVLDEIDPDVVHVHASVVSPLPLVAALAAARAGRPTVVTVHSLWAYLSTPYRAIAAATGIGRLPIEWTAVSAAAARQVQHVLGPAREVHVLPNGIDAGYWERTPRVADDERPDIVVAAVMRLTARKRPLAVLSALRAARTALPPHLPVRAMIIGDGPHRRPLHAYLAMHRMQDWVQVHGLGNREQVRQLLARADVFVAAARLESFGIAALEARCAGVPVIAREDTGIADFVRHGREGLLVSSTADLASALTRILVSGDVRQAMARHNRLTRSGFGWPVTLAAAATAYRRAGAVPDATVTAPVTAAAG